MARFPRVSVLAWISLAALTTACGAAAEPSTAGSGQSSQANANASTQVSPAGDAAVWVVGPTQSLRASSTKFTALVSRLDCNSGVTGHVLAPKIQMRESEAVVTFVVAPQQPGYRTCQSNDQVAYEVDLGEPLGDRALIDGHCLPGEEAATTSLCRPDSVRFSP